jgi:hypothetical protein
MWYGTEREGIDAVGKQTERLTERFLQDHHVHGVRRWCKPATNRMRCTVASLLLVLLIAPGCMVWRPLDAPTLTSQPAEAIRVTRADGSVITLLRPSVRNDSLVGVGEDGWGVVAVALSDVTEIAARRESDGRTLGLLAGLVAAGVLISFTIALRSFGS